MKQMLECPRESDVLDALASQRWPQRAERELVEHVASCEICRDVLVVAAAMREDHDATWREASLPSSGQVWWRAEMRARQQAIRDASRPIAVAYGVAAVAALVVLAIAAWFAWPVAHEFVASIVATPKTTLESPITLPLLLAVGAFLIVAPVALYLVLSDE
jgi:uncharacterized protein (DUF2062 family)